MEKYIVSLHIDLTFIDEYHNIYKVWFGLDCQKIQNFENVLNWGCLFLGGLKHLDQCKTKVAKIY